MQKMRNARCKTPGKTGRQKEKISALAKVLKIQVKNINVIQLSR